MFNNEVTRVENFFESRGGRRQCCDSNSQPAAALEPVLRGGVVGNVAIATIRQPPANGNSGKTQLQPSLVIYTYKLPSDVSRLGPRPVFSIAAPAT